MFYVFDSEPPPGPNICFSGHRGQRVGTTFFCVLFEMPYKTALPPHTLHDFFDQHTIFPSLLSLSHPLTLCSCHLASPPSPSLTKKTPLLCSNCHSVSFSCVAQRLIKGKRQSKKKVFTSTSKSRLNDCNTTQSNQHSTNQ